MEQTYQLTEADAALILKQFDKRCLSDPGYDRLLDDILSDTAARELAARFPEEQEPERWDGLS